MCGIVGYIGHRPATGLLLEGLAQLEYRGYDSAGVALGAGAGEPFVCTRTVGPLENLTAALAGNTSTSTLGIGHTRWATHGRVTERNAHPHLSEDGRIAVVMNGIVENYAELREELREEGVHFASETDAEVIPHLIARAYDGDLVAAVHAARRQLQGQYTIVVADARTPDLLVAVRHQTPLVVGVGDGEAYLASAIPAFLAQTREVITPEDDELCVVERGEVRLERGGARVRVSPTRVDWTLEAAQKGGYATFMEKEIHEQPGVLAETLRDRVGPDGHVRLRELGLDDAALAHVRQVQIVACGTSYHAALAGRYLIEDWARIPVSVEVASEYRYRTCLAGPGDLVIGISQSGETADTLAAMRLARERGAHVVALTNVQGSQATRDADGVILTRAGLEIGVAATKTHTAQIMALALLAIKLGRMRLALTDVGAMELLRELQRLPELLRGYLSDTSRLERVQAAAHRAARRDFFLYLGRHVGVPVAYEGALKLKEISYIPTEAYPAGEMKHGPIALIEQDTPVIVVATDGHVLDKVRSNMAEVKARGAYVVAVVSEGSAHGFDDVADEVLTVPHSPALLSPLCAVVPLQLFALGVASARGLDVDKPRNLAKTVTVE